MSKEKTSKRKLLVIALVTSIIVIIGGVAIGVPLGIRNANNNEPHPKGDWSFRITGDGVLQEINITINELLEMPYFEEDYIIRGKITETARYRGVQIAYLLQTVVQLSSEAISVNFTAWDGYSVVFSLSEVLNEEAMILAFQKDGEYLAGPEEDGTGYLRLIDPAKDDSDYNGPRCLKNVVELVIS